jgi:hypothetical protein
MNLDFANSGTVRRTRHKQVAVLRCPAERLFKADFPRGLALSGFFFGAGNYRSITKESPISGKPPSHLGFNLESPKGNLCPNLRIA